MTRLLRVLLVSFAALACCGAKVAAAGYTLYYVDAARNIRCISLDASGSAVGKSERLTSKGGYDHFSVSPDGNRFVGFTMLDRSFDAETTKSYWTIWRCFIEQIGAQRFRRNVTKMDPLMESPIVCWSPGGNYFQLLVGAFDVDIDIYSFSPTKKITSVFDVVSISRDERYVLGHCSGSELSVVDLRTGKSAVLSETGDEGVWIGDTHKVAWIEYSGEALGGEIVSKGSVPELAGRARLSTGQTKTIFKRLPEQVDWWESVRKSVRQKGLIADEAAYSPDHKLVACPVKSAKGRPPEIMVFDRSGRAHRVAAGRTPQWQGSHLWDSWDSS